MQELEESIYWMKLLRESAVMTSADLDSLLKNADELMAILTSGVRRLKFVRK